MLALAAICMLACTGKSVQYVIAGNKAPQDGTVVYLIDKISDTPIDSAIVADGAFEMKGKALKDALLSVQLDGWGWYFPVFNDGEPVQINVADSTVTGSELNTKLSECDRGDGARYAEFNRFVQAFLALPKAEQEAREAEFIPEYQARYEEYADSYVGMIEDNLDNLIPVAFIQNVPMLADKDKFDELVSSDAPFAKHPYVLAVKQKIDDSFAKEKAIEDAKEAFIGQKFIDLEEPAPDGTMHKLSEYVGQGKWVLVDFWASWCGPCKAEMPNVVAAYKKYHGKGFDIVGISFDREKDPWVKAIKEWDMPWIHLSDLQYWKNAASGLYSVNSIPDNLLIDPEGTVVARGLRGNALDERLAEIFK